MRRHDHAATRLALALATTFGLGHRRPAPGTWGSLPPIVLAAALIALGLGPAGAPVIYNAALVAVALLFTAACVAAGDLAEARFGKKDPGQVVADETAGQCLPLLALPAAALDTPIEAAITLAVAFLAFRALDILKPWPANALQRVPGGWGIVLDDLAAGAYAALVTQVLVRLAF